MEVNRTHQPPIPTEFASEGLCVNEPASPFPLWRETDYGIFTVTPDSGFTAVALRERGEDELGWLWGEKLFLVPGRLREAFQRLALNGRAE